MGVAGGLAGAAMVAVNNRITALRKRFVPPARPARRVAEVVLLAALTATAWLLPSYLSPCLPVPPRPYLSQLGLVASSGPGGPNATSGTDAGDGGGLVDEHYVQEQAAAGGPAGGAEALARTPTVLYAGLYPQLWCPAGSYSSYGMLFFLPQMTAISLLFQFEVWGEEVAWKVGGGGVGRRGWERGVGAGGMEPGSGERERGARSETPLRASTYHLPSAICRLAVP